MSSSREGVAAPAQFSGDSQFGDFLGRVVDVIWVHQGSINCENCVVKRGTVAGFGNFWSLVQVWSSACTCVWVEGAVHVPSPRCHCCGKGDSIPTCVGLDVPGCVQVGSSWDPESALWDQMGEVLCVPISVTGGVCLLKNHCSSFADAQEFRLNFQGLLVSLLSLFLVYVFVYSLHWDEGAFSMEVQGICSHIIDFLMEISFLLPFRGAVLDEVISDSLFQVYLFFSFFQDPIYSLLSVSEFSTGLFTPRHVLGKLHDLAWRPQEGKWGLLVSLCRAVLGPALCSPAIPGLLHYLCMCQLGTSLSPWHWVFLFILQFISICSLSSRVQDSLEFGQMSAYGTSKGVCIFSATQWKNPAQ